MFAAGFFPCSQPASHCNGATGTVVQVCAFVPGTALAHTAPTSKILSRPAAAAGLCGVPIEQSSSSGSSVGTSCYSYYSSYSSSGSMCQSSNYVERCVLECRRSEPQLSVGAGSSRGEKSFADTLQLKTWQAKVERRVLERWRHDSTVSHMHAPKPELSSWQAKVERRVSERWRQDSTLTHMHAPKFIKWQI